MLGHDSAHLSDGVGEVIGVPLRLSTLGKLLGRESLQGRDEVLVGDGEHANVPDDRLDIIWASTIVVVKLVEVAQHGCDGLRVIIVEVNLALASFLSQMSVITVTYSRSDQSTDLESTTTVLLEPFRLRTKQELVGHPFAVLADDEEIRVLLC